MCFICFLIKNHICFEGMNRDDFIWDINKQMSVLLSLSAYLKEHGHDLSLKISKFSFFIFNV